MLGNDILIQTNDYTLPYDYIDYKVGNEEEGEREEIIFGLRMVKWAKSNAAVVVKNKTLWVRVAVWWIGFPRLRLPSRRLGKRPRVDF